MKLTITNVIAQIRAHHETACESARTLCDAVIKCGEGLSVLKSMVPHGGWEETVREIGMKPRTASDYMRVAACKSKDPKKMKYLLDNGASLVELLREFGQVKPLPIAGYDADKYEQRKAASQLDLFSYEDFLNNVKSAAKADLSKLEERSLTVALRETQKAQARIEAEIASRKSRVIDLDSSNHNDGEKQP